MSDFAELNFAEIKQKYNIYDVATQKLGLSLRPVGNGEYRGVSIAQGTHQHDDGLSVNIDKGEWYDFSIDTGGDVIDLVAYVKYGSCDNVNRLEAAKYLDGDTNSGGAWSRYTKQRIEFENDVEKWHKALLQDSRTLEYLHGRRISDETIERFKLGFDNEYIKINGETVQEWRLMCPYLDRNGKPIYVASRQLSWTAHEGSRKYNKRNTKHKDNVFLKNSVFGLNTLKDGNDTLILGEGMFDALSFAQEGYSILFSIGGFYGKDNTAQVMNEAAKFRQIITCYDIDENLSGQRFTCAIGRQLLKAGLPFRAIANYGEGHKDVSDYYTDGGDLRELLETSTVNGYVFMSRFTFWQNTPKEFDCPFDNLSKVEKTTALTEIKKFVYRLKSFLSDKDFNEVLQALANYYPADTIKKFAEGATPQEQLELSCDEFLDGKHIFYFGHVRSGSYWQYNNEGYWTRLTDAAMQSEISHFFNHKKAVRTVKTLTEMVRLKDTRQKLPDFNSKRLWLFQNGVLDLDSGTLREPMPDDYLTWQVSYNYDANATCPKFDKFLNEVTCGNQSRLNTIDDLLGYILFENNRLDKLFCLIGDGMNGKSVFLKTLQKLVESVNTQASMPSVTNVALKNFSIETQLIRLNGSLVNLSYDINQNLKDCEDSLKSVISGDTISGNYKFCDSVDFTPRCKLVCASNHMLRVRDDSFGMARKIAFCRFAACFKGRANTHLLEELQTELSGIFNRMYRAYQALLEREKTCGADAIRLCDDQAEFMSEFTQIASPAAAFWSERHENYIGREVKKAVLFDDFKIWCERNGKYAGSENHFHKALKKVVEDSGCAITESKPRENGTQIRYLYISEKPKETT